MPSTRFVSSRRRWRHDPPRPRTAGARQCPDPRCSGDAMTDEYAAEYLVYEHWHNHGCFYVGCGNTERAHKVFRTGQGDALHRAVYDTCRAAGIDIQVVIVKKFSNKKEAIEFEKQRTLWRFGQGQPLVNRNWGTTPSAATLAKMEVTKSRPSRWAERNSERLARSMGEVHMTPRDFRQIRANLEYSQSEFADALGIQSVRTIQRYESGDRTIPLQVVLLLRSVGAVKPTNVQQT